MARYGAKFSQATLTTTFKTAGSLRAPAASMRRIKLYDLTLGSGGTPADNVLEFGVQRSTSVPTDTTLVPAPFDPADAACVATFGSNATVEPTLTSATFLLDGFVNQRATYRWVAAPGSELVIPATANNGVSVLGLSPAYTGSFGGSLAFEEQ